ncbi:MAG TPA: hypothetical protein VNJ01_16145 [Bacteriovoracaceae bacterium]|nr:hypothetical protein [Bacteriovoracaceae bacterium]
MKTSLFLIFSLSLTVGCSKPVKKESNQDLVQKFNQMQDTAAAIYQKETINDQSSSQHFLNMLDENHSLGVKMIEASKYFLSMEFQHWTNSKTTHTFKTLDAMFEDSALDFTRRMMDLNKILDLEDMNPINHEKKHSNEIAFYALAATMDDKLGSLSFYELTKRSLIKDLNGKTLLGYEETLLSGVNKEIMIELIKARVDILATLALNDLKNEKEISLGQKSKNLIKKMFGGKDESGAHGYLSKINSSTKTGILKNLEGALAAKNFLIELGIDKDLHKKLKKAYANIDFNEKDAQNQPDKSDKIESIRIAINNLLE